jgi:hypothetical protein
MADTNKPHWAWPHVVGVASAILVYFLIYRFTGDSDLFIALATGAGGMAATWGYIRFLALSRDDSARTPSSRRD